METVAKQKHYACYAIQPIEFIMRNKLDYCTGNVIKYVCRHGLKNGIEDLKKAIVYLEFMIKQLEGKPIVSKENK